MLGLFLLNSGPYFFSLYSAPSLMIPICCAYCRVEYVRPVGTVIQRPMWYPPVADMVILFPCRDTPIIAAIIMDGLAISMSQNSHGECVDMFVLASYMTHTQSTPLLMISITFRS